MRSVVALAVLAALLFTAPAAAGPAADQIAQLEARVAALESRVTALEGPSASPSSAPMPSPSASPSVSPSPTPSASPTPTPAPTASPVPTPVPCGGSLQSVIDAVPAGGTVDLGTCPYTLASVSITKAITIKRGTIRPTAQHAVAIRSNDVTFDGTAFEGGPGWTVDVFGVDRTQFLNTTWTGASETYLRLVGPGIDGVTIEGGTFTVRGDYSAVSADDNLPFGQDFKNVTIRGTTLDQGPRNTAWFGYEVWGVQGLLIEGNTFRGDDVHISIPRSDGAIIRNNTFDLTATGWASVELADIENVQVTGNTVTGPSPSTASWNAFVQMHPGGGAIRNVTISGNRVTNFPALFNAAEANTSGHIVRDNCLQNVPRLYWGNPPAGSVTMTNNGPCP